MLRLLFFCLLAGAAAAFSLPDSGVGTFVFDPTPYSFPVFACSFGVLFLSLRRSSSAFRSAAIAYIWALGYFTAGLSWVANALLIDGNPYAWAYPLALFGLPALLSLFHAVAFGVGYRLMQNRREWLSALIFITLFTVSEIARGTLFTGFPWLLPSMYWANTPLFLGISTFGQYGLTFLTLLFIFSVLHSFIRQSSPVNIQGAIGILIFGLMSIWVTSDAYKNKFNYDASGNEIQVVLVQANIPQSEKWDGEKLIDHFYTHLTLSKRPDNLRDQPTVIIWPETALAPSFVNAPMVQNQIAQLLATYPKDSVLLTGALRAEKHGDEMRYYNSAIIYDATGGIIATYDKSHLVPFGEYMPFQNYIPIGPIAQFEGLQPGPGPKTLSAPHIPPFAPLICYEVIFPGFTKGLGARWLVSLTNDSWYGNTAGPRQHLALARAQAIATGLPLVRVAGTGISAIIHADGTVQSRISYNQKKSETGIIHINTVN